MSDIVYGLDFGTSNSAVAILNRNGQSEVLKIGNNQSKTIRSVLFFPYVRKGVRLHFVGDEAVLNYISSNMQGRFLQSIKSVLTEEFFSGTLIQGDFLEADDLVAFILKHIKEKADGLVGEDVKKVVLGKPVKFFDEQSSEITAEQRLFVAAQKAGFKEIKFQLEPIAAALHYETSLSLIDGEKLVFIADLGGGTSDFTIMKLSLSKISNLDRKEDILASNGIYIGGDNFDSDIMWNKLCTYFGLDSTFKSYEKILPFPVHIVRKICRWQDISFMKNRDVNLTLEKFLRTSSNPQAIKNLQILINQNLGFSLFGKIEEAKIILSSSEIADILFNCSDIKIYEKINKSEFNEFIHDKLIKIESTIEELLNMANVKPNQIDAVFVTGGTSIMPDIRQIFEKKFGIEKITSTDSFTSVVSGLALSSRLFFRKK